MAEYEITTKDGKFVLSGPADMSDAEIIAAFKKQMQASEDKQRNSIIGAIDSASRGLARGALMNFDDEIVSGLNTVLPLDKLTGKDVKSVWDGVSLAEAFKHNMRVEARTTAADRRANPVISGGSEIIGAVAGAGKGLKATKAVGARVLPKAPKAVQAATKTVIGSPVARSAVGQGAATGLVAGTISGFGAGDTLESRRKGAVTGGTVGTVLGGGVGLTVAKLTPVVRKYWDAFRGRNVDQAALKSIQARLAEDGFDVSSPEGVKALEEELAKFAGKPVSLADIGDATRARAGVAMRAQTPAAQQGIDTVAERQAGQADRLNADIQARVAPRTDIYDIDENLVETRAAVANPLRQEAFFDDTGVERIPGATIQGLAHLPMAQRALTQARELAIAERLRREVLGQPVDDLADFPEPGTPLSMRTMDALKRYLDDEVNRAYGGKGSFSVAEADQLKELRNALRDSMRAEVPVYGDYLDAYGDVSGMRSALAAGRGGPRLDGRGSEVGFDRMDPEAIARGQAERGVAAQEFYRVGAARRMQDVVNDTTSGQPADRILNSPNARARLEATGVPIDDVRALEEAVRQERQMGRLAGEVQGGLGDSGRLAARNQVSSEGLAVALPWNPMSKWAWGGWLSRHVLGNIDLTRNGKINEVALPRLLAQDPAVIQRTIQELQTTGQTQAALELQRAATSRKAASVTGNIIGAPVTMREGEY